MNALGRVTAPRYRRDVMSSTPSPSHPSVSPAPRITPDTTVDPSVGDGDHDRFAHICRKEDVARSYVTVEPIEALCGKKWVPSRDPENYPVCPACKEALAKVEAAGDN